MLSERETDQILQFVAVLNSQLHLDQLLPTVLDISLTMVGAERAFLMLYDSEQRLSICCARSHSKRDLSHAEFEGSHSIVEKVLQDQRALCIQDVSQCEEFRSAESVRIHNIRSAVCIPLQEFQSEGNPTEPIGVLYLDSSSSGNVLGEDRLRLISGMINHVCVAIRNAQLFTEVERQKKEIAGLNKQLAKKLEQQTGNLKEMKVLLAETQRELGRVYGLGNIIGKSPAMRKVFQLLEKVTPTEVTVLILGESGVGKELIARYIHYNGPRAEKPMLSVNCSAFNDTLLESELFGHKKGTFTGATENKVGLFRVADGGTLFLDEIGDMSQEMQKKLLRVLQNGELRPLGENETFHVNVRIIAATNKNLEEMVRQKTFREDLYFRLNVINITLPPLRERREDIPLLVDYFTHALSEEMQKPLPGPGADVMNWFLEYDWPGNIRELENELRRVFILGPEYRPELLRPVSDMEGSEMRMTTVEKRAILKALAAANGNKRKAAEMLGIPRSSFYLKLAKYKIF